MDQDQMNSVKLFDTVRKCQYQILIPKISPTVKNDSSNEDTLTESQSIQNITTWNQTETLALINIFSLFKDRFKDFKKRKEQWNLISEELAKIGINKIPEKCEIKWKNLLRAYRQHKIGNKGQGKFEFFNELDDIVSSDKQHRYLIQYKNDNPINTKYSSNLECTSQYQNHQVISSRRNRCSCHKSKKQKRHEDRMAIMAKKLEIEERKVKAFEEYLQFLRSSTQKICCSNL